MSVPRFIRNVLLWLLPVALLWIGFKGFYNRFLTIGTENLLHLVESPDVTQLVPFPEDRNYIHILRKDFPEARRKVYSVRVTDLHYHLVLLGALFLATPVLGLEAASGQFRLGVPDHRLLRSPAFFLLGQVRLRHTARDLEPGELWVPAGRNFFGLGKHLLDLPFKLALPFALWVGFYFPLLARHRER